MIYILIGCFAFILAFIFDYNKLQNKPKKLNFSFALSIIIIVFSTTAILLYEDSTIEISPKLQILTAAISFISLCLLIHSLFFALPFANTYTKIEKKYRLVNTGMYSLCRHPGVIWFFFFYIFLGLASGKSIMVWAALTWSLINLIYAYIQDRWLFPVLISGYEQYRRQVPFIIPDKTSIRRYFNSKFI